MAYGRMSGTVVDNPIQLGGAGGRTAYGTVPGPIDVPENIYSQVSGVMPGLAGLTGGASDIIASQQAGQISPATLNALKSASATFGVQSGMPGSGLSTNQLFGNIAGFSEKLQQQGVENWLASLAGVGRSMTDPTLSAEIAARNAALAAAPDPQLAAKQQMADWLEKFNLTQQYAGAGTGAYAGAGPIPGSPLRAGGGGGRVDALGFPIDTGPAFQSYPTLVGGPGFDEETIYTPGEAGGGAGVTPGTTYTPGVPGGGRGIPGLEWWQQPGADWTDFMTPGEEFYYGAE